MLCQIRIGQIAIKNKAGKLLADSRGAENLKLKGGEIKIHLLALNPQIMAAYHCVNMG